MQFAPCDPKQELFYTIWVQLRQTSSGFLWAAGPNGSIQRSVSMTAELEFSIRRLYNVLRVSFSWSESQTSRKERRRLPRQSRLISILSSKLTDVPKDGWAKSEFFVEVHCDASANEKYWRWIHLLSRYDLDDIRQIDGAVAGKMKRHYSPNGAGCGFFDMMRISLRPRTMAWPIHTINSVRKWRYDSLSDCTIANETNVCMRIINGPWKETCSAKLAGLWPHIWKWTLSRRQ